jgi:hypothetical protein
MDPGQVTDLWCGELQADVYISCALFEIAFCLLDVQGCVPSFSVSKERRTTLSISDDTIDTMESDYPLSYTQGARHPLHKDRKVNSKCKKLNQALELKAPVRATSVSILSRM